MIRGTTPTLEFSLPFDTSNIAECYATIAQNKKVIIDKSLDAMTTYGKTLKVSLTQDDTLKLKSDTISEIQLRVRTVDGDALASEIIRVNTSRILKDGVI